MDKPTFNSDTQCWEFVMFGRVESHKTESEATEAIRSHINWMFSDADYDTYEEN